MDLAGHCLFRALPPNCGYAEFFLLRFAFGDDAFYLARHFFLMSVLTHDELCVLVVYFLLIDHTITTDSKLQPGALQSTIWLCIIFYFFGDKYKLFKNDKYRRYK